MNKLNNITIFDLQDILLDYLKNIHPVEYNGFIIRLSSNISDTFNKRSFYTISFPNLNNIDLILSEWYNYALTNIIKTNDIIDIISIISIDPIKIYKNIEKITIQYGGLIINQEEFIKKLSFDIIDEMNKHLIEVYFDNEYPEINEIDEINEKFNDIDINIIYNKYPQANIYIPISIKKDNISDLFYINGIINTNTNAIDIINNLRKCLDSEDITEILSYNKEDIIYKYNNYELLSFDIITEPDL